MTQTYTLQLSMQGLRCFHQTTPLHQIPISPNTSYSQFYKLVSQIASLNSIQHFTIILTARDNLTLTQQKFQPYLKQLPHDAYCRYLTIQQYDQCERIVWAVSQFQPNEIWEGSEQGYEIVQCEEMLENSNQTGLRVNEQLQLNSQKLSHLLDQINTQRPRHPHSQPLHLKVGALPFFNNDKEDMNLLQAIGLVEKHASVSGRTQQTQFAGQGLKNNELSQK